MSGALLIYIGAVLYAIILELCCLIQKLCKNQHLITFKCGLATSSSFLLPCFLLVVEKAS
jgi:hypothetical protein